MKEKVQKKEDIDFKVEENSKEEKFENFSLDEQQKLLTILKIKSIFVSNRSLVLKLKRNIARIKTLKNINKDVN